MMARVSERRGDGRTGWYLRGDELLFEAFAGRSLRRDRRTSAGLHRCDRLCARYTP